MAEEDETQIGKRREDLEISFFGIKLKGTARSIASLMNGAVGILALAGVMLWHDHKNDIAVAAVHEAIWFQTLTLATPQEDRIRMLKDNAAKLPESVRSKIAGQQ